MKTPANHPWKGKAKKVKTTCLTCGAVFERDQEVTTYTCSEQCTKDYKKAKYVAHLTRGGFR